MWALAVKLLVSAMIGSKRDVPCVGKTVSYRYTDLRNQVMR